MAKYVPMLFMIAFLSFETFSMVGAIVLRSPETLTNQTYVIVSPEILEQEWKMVAAPPEAHILARDWDLACIRKIPR
jgi:hypothetical protein